MNLLDRHIFKSVLVTCGGAVMLFAFVLILGNAVKDLLGYVLAGQFTLGVFSRLVLLLIPFVISYALPLGMLTGVLLTLGRLSADCEITAMRAAGLSLTRIARPVFLLGALGMATGLYVNFESMPWARVEYHRQLASAVQANPLNFIVPKTFTQFPNAQSPKAIIYVGEKQGTILRDFWLWKLDQNRLVTQFVRGESGHFDFDQATDELVLTLTNVMVEDRDEKDPENFTIGPRWASADKYGPQHLSLELIFGSNTAVRTRLPWMTYRQLKAEEIRLAAQTVPPEAENAHAREEMKVKMTVQDKFNTAVAVLSFALVGVPLGIRVSRRETSANLGVAVLLALGYYLLTVMVGWLDRHPEYRPDLLLWVPNLILVGFSLWLFARIDRK